MYMYMYISTSSLHPTERVIQDGLYYEFTRYCSTAVIRMYGEGKDTSAMVKFDSYVKPDENG